MSGRCDNYHRGIFKVEGAHWFGQQRFLVKDSTAVFLASVLGVVITLVGTRLWVLISISLRAIVRRFLHGSTVRQAQPADQAIPLLPRPGNAGTPHTERSIVAEAMEEVSHNAHSDIGAGFRLLLDLSKLLKNFRLHREEILVKLGLALCFFTLFILVTLGGIFSANVVLNSAALCKSPQCGDWDPIIGLGLNSSSLRLQTETEKQVTAAALAAKCYRGSHSTSECGSLLSRSLSYTRNETAQCPLNGDDVCVGGFNTALHLDTGYQHARTLGINSREDFYFRRALTCAPLVINATYLRSGKDASGAPTWRYYYGREGKLDHTFETAIRPWDTKQAAYLIETTTEDFEPLTAFQSPLGKVLLISILPSSIIYIEPSRDPIFHATVPQNVDAGTVWVRSIQVAGILSCVDEMEVCLTNRKTCWKSYELARQWLDANGRNTSANINALKLVFTPLRRSSLSLQIRIRYDAALQVRALLSRPGWSAGTGNWRQETEGFFQTCLAYLQNDVLNIANGAFCDLHGTQNLLEIEEGPGYDWRGTCDMVLVTAPDFKSVSLWGVLSILGLSLLIFLISINPDDKLVVLNFLMRFARQAKEVVEFVIVKLVMGCILLFLTLHSWYSTEGQIQLREGR